MKAENTQVVNAVTEMETSMARRLLYVVAGLFFVGVAGIGALLPGIPTVGPLLIASFLLAKSSPSLERTLIRNRFFSPYLKFMDGSTEMPWRARILSLGIMWTSIIFSSLVLLSLKGVGFWGPLGLAIAGLVGSWFILTCGKRTLGSDSSNGISLVHSADNLRAK